MPYLPVCAVHATTTERGIRADVCRVRIACVSFVQLCSQVVRSIVL